MKIDLDVPTNALAQGVWLLVFWLVLTMITGILVARCIGAVAVALFNLPAALLRKGRG